MIGDKKFDILNLLAVFCLQLVFYLLAALGVCWQLREVVAELRKRCRMWLKRIQLRRRVFRHFQRLDVAFHDRYTSGRVVSRLTNDVDAIQDMLETGFDSLITAVLTLFGTAILLVVLDVRLGLMCLAAFPILVALVWWAQGRRMPAAPLPRHAAVA